MNVLGRLNKPEYIFRPVQLLAAVKELWQRERDVVLAHDRRVVTLPWKLQIEISLNDDIGRTIRRLGTYDLSVSEAIWRLLDAGEIAIDVGANIGYMTSIMATRAAVSGTVIAFEPHPVLFTELALNVERWQSVPIAKIALHNLAISDRKGMGTLIIPEAFARNRGLSSVAQSAASSGAPVTLETLDNLIGDRLVSLLKVDVEGHELQVFEGAVSTLAKRSVRNIIFEEQGDYPTKVTRFLESYGYEVYQLGMRFLGAVLIPAKEERRIPRRQWEPRSLLATIDSADALNRFRARGWCVFKERVR
jgi:FkbM family methyltransferase